MIFKRKFAKLDMKETPMYYGNLRPGKWGNLSFVCPYKNNMAMQLVYSTLEEDGFVGLYRTRE